MVPMTPKLASLVAGAFSRPGDPLPCRIIADFLEEEGLDGRAWREQSCGAPPPASTFRSGSGYGDGDGDGDGYGDGYGDGSGYGSGYGFGSGYGSGDGSGYGYGDGYGEPRTLNFVEVLMLNVGSLYLMMIGHGWAVCGRIAQQTGPFSYEVEDCSIVCNTGGTPWDRLAEGEGRDGAAFRPWGTTTIATGFMLAREWKGDLPPQQTPARATTRRRRP